MSVSGHLRLGLASTLWRIVPGTAGTSGRRTPIKMRLPKASRV